MYIEKFEKFGLQQFLEDIFSSQKSSKSIKKSQDHQSDDFVSFTQLDNLIEETMRKSPENPEFQGFLTGKGQKLQIDSSKLENASKLFEKDDSTLIEPSSFISIKAINSQNNAKIHEKMSEPTCISSFQTIKHDNSKNLKKMSEPTVFSRIKTNFNENPVLKNNKDFSDDDKNFVPAINKQNINEFSSFAGFQTAKGNQIKINDKKLKDAEKMLFLEDEEEFTFFPGKFNAEEPSDFKNFQPNNVQNHEKKSNFKVFQTFKDNQVLNDNDEKKPKHIEQPDFKGFQTAKGNIIIIDEIKLKDAEKLLTFNDKNEKFSLIQENNKKPSKFINSPSNLAKVKEKFSFEGFQTAKGNLMTVNMKNIQEAEILLKDNEFSSKDKNEKHIKTSENVKNPLILNSPAFIFDKQKGKTTPSFEGFQTGNGNIIKINEKKFQEAENLLRDNDNSLTNEVNPLKKETKMSFFEGFQTAKGNTIQINEKKVQEAEVLLKDNELSFSTNNEKSSNFPVNIKKTQINENKGKNLLSKRSPEKHRFLDFKNKKLHRIKEKSPENNQNINNLLTQNKRNMTKSSEKLKVTKGTSKKILTEKSTRIFSSFNKTLDFSNKMKKPENSQKKRSFEKFIDSCEKNDLSLLELQKTTSKSKICSTIPENTIKTPNSVFSFQSKSFLSKSNQKQSLINLKDLQIIPDKEANKAWDIQEIAAVSYNFICDCVSFSQNSCDKCICNGKFIITNEFFHRFLQEKFQKVQIKENWIKHHYRLIIWKLSSYSKHITPLLQNKVLSLENTLKELENRLLTENSGKRSIIKKILEKDEIIGKHMVLMIGRISYIPEQKFYIIELSDGWYPIYLVIFNNSKENSKNLFYSNNNALLLDLLLNKKLFSGLKVHVIGLEKSPYQNLSSFFDFEGIYSEKLLVNISYNNLCRAKWSEKLGLKRTRFLLRNLNALRSGGGFVSLIDVFVLKKYPLLERKNNKICYYTEDNQKNKAVFFKLNVIDALIFEKTRKIIEYEEKKEFFQRNYVEINFFNMGIELYDNIREGERLRISNLKADDRDKTIRKRFDFIKNEINERKISLEITKFSKIMCFNDLKKDPNDKKEVKKFGKELCENQRRTITNISCETDIVNKFKKERFDNKKLINELDCLLFVFSVDLKNKDIISGNDMKNNEIRIKIHDKEFFNGRLADNMSGKIILFLNIALDSFSNHFSMEKKIQKKVIMLYTIENTKIITINTKIQEFYPEEFKVLYKKYFGNKIPNEKLDVDKIIKEIEENEGI